MQKSSIEKVVNHSKVFTANRIAYEEKKYRAIINEGSSRSSKSYSIALLMCKIALTEKKHITVVSPSLPHLKRGAMKDVLDVLKGWDVYRDKNHNKTDSILNFPRTGAVMEFFGTEQVDKLRGPGRDILWCNEMNLIPYAAYVQLALRTREVIFGDLNPSDEYSWVYKIADDNGNKSIHSTYKDNPFLSPEQVREIESLKDADDNLWRVFGLGLRGVSTETIYTHYKTIDNFPACDDVFYGLDFGFNHPTALVKCGLIDGKQYVEEIIYERGITTEDIIYLLGVHGIDKSSPIYCDSARPDTIEELYKAGYNVHKADKSVIDGINLIKSRPLNVVKSSVNLLKEIQSYKWKTDKNGKVLDEPVKHMDDAMDAKRYGFYTHDNKPKKQFAYIENV